MPQGDDFLPAGVKLGGLRRRFVGFSAAVGEEGFFQLAGRDFGKLGRQLRLRRVGIKRRSVRQLFDLIHDGIGHLRMRVAQAGGQYAAKTIQIFVAGFIPHVHALAVFQGDGFLVIHRDGGEEKIFVFLDSIRSRSVLIGAHKMTVLLLRMEVCGDASNAFGAAHYGTVICRRQKEFGYNFQAEG